MIVLLFNSLIIPSIKAEDDPITIMFSHPESGNIFQPIPLTYTIINNGNQTLDVEIEFKANDSSLRGIIPLSLESDFHQNFTYSNVKYIQFNQTGLYKLSYIVRVLPDIVFQIDSYLSIENTDPDTIVFNMTFFVNSSDPLMPNTEIWIDFYLKNALANPFNSTYRYVHVAKLDGPFQGGGTSAWPWLIHVGTHRLGGILVQNNFPGSITRFYYELNGTFHGEYESFIWEQLLHIGETQSESYFSPPKLIYSSMPFSYPPNTTDTPDTTDTTDTPDTSIDTSIDTTPSSVIEEENSTSDMLYSLITPFTNPFELLIFLIFLPLIKRKRTVYKKQ